MQAILYIFFHNIVPILLLVLAGFAMGKAFKLDLNTLTKINFYLFVPAFTFTYLYTAEIGRDQYKALLAAFLILIVSYSVALLPARILKFEEGVARAFQNSMMFYNSGNIGVPLITLVFSTGYYASLKGGATQAAALTIQVMVLVVQNLFTNTLGFYNASRGQGRSVQDAVRTILKMPTIYSILTVLILRQVPAVDLTTLPIWPALEYSRNALVAIALVTLGVQLSRTAFAGTDKRILTAAVMRLLGGPLIALCIIALLRIDGIAAGVLFISASVPTAVNTALLASECKNHPDFAAQVVLLTTLACPLTLIPVIYAAPLLFPVV